MDEQDIGEAPLEPAGEPGGASATSALKEGATVSRNQNVVHVLPRDWSMMGPVLAPLLEKLDPGSTVTQLLILASDQPSVLAAAEAVVQTQGDSMPPEILPVTTVRRASRLSSDKTPLVVIATPSDAAELIAGSSLKLDQLQTIAFAWLDEHLEDESSAASIEAVMAEIPKTARRLLVAATPSPVVDAFVERYMRRARRLEDQPTGEPLTRNVEFMAAPAGGRPGSLRRLLDDLDPATCVIRVRTPQGAEEARSTLQRLGYASRDAVRVVDAEDSADAELVVLYELPERRDELRSVMDGTEGRVVALVEPRQIVTLRRVAGAASAQPFALAAEPRRARERQALLLGGLEARLTSERFDRELLALEPLLGAYDGLEIAAALLRMLDDEQTRSSARVMEALTNASLMAADKAAEVAAQPPDATPSGTWSRVFINVGERDGASPGDLVGAITGEADVTRDVIGKIDLRENFSIVEISSAVADKVIESLSGANLRGRHVQARLDRDEGGRGRFEGGGRPERGGRAGGGRPSRDFGGSGERGFGRPSRGFDRGERGDRGDRGAGRPSRGFDRGDRGERGERGAGRPSRGFDRGERGERSFDRPSRGFDRGDRSDRGERSFDRPSRGFDRGDRGERGERSFNRPSRGFDRGDRGGRGPRPFDRGNREGGSGGGGGRDGSFDRGPRNFGGGRDRDERGGGRGPGRDRGYGRTQADDRQEWRERGERLRNSRGDAELRAARRAREREEDGK